VLPPLVGQVGGVGHEAEDGAVEARCDVVASGHAASVAAALAYGGIVTRNDCRRVLEGGEAALVYEADLGIGTLGGVDGGSLELFEGLSVTLAGGKVLLKGDGVVHLLLRCVIALGGGGAACSRVGACEALETGGAGDCLGGRSCGLGGAPARQNSNITPKEEHDQARKFSDGHHAQGSRRGSA
jgi:hypothetical protein